MDAGINPIKQNLNIKQYIGWMIAVFIPFSIKSISEYTRNPIITAILYWIICGIILRFLMHKKMPYFKPSIKIIKKEVIALILISSFAIYLYFIDSNKSSTNFDYAVITHGILFALLNGCFEQLVWVNILDLAGARVKINGFIAVFIYSILVNTLFWNKFISMPNLHTSLFFVLQIILTYISLVIYMKTEDITVLGIQRIIYNLMILLMAVFGTNLIFNI